MTPPKLTVEKTVKPLKIVEKVSTSENNKNNSNWLKRPDKGIEQAKSGCEKWGEKMTSIEMIEVVRRAGYGIRTRDLNFGKVACCHYTKPACTLLTTWSIAD